MANRSFRQVLGQPNFFRLWMGQIISSVGDRFYQFALLKVVLDGTELGRDTARLAFFGMLPGLVLAPLLGWIVDRFERRRVMIATDLVRAALALALIYYGYEKPSFPVIFAVMFAMGAMNGLFIPARQAAVPQIVRAEHLVTANALIAMVGIIASMVASILAVLIIEIFNERSSFVITALGFLASAWVVWRIDKPLLPGEAIRTGGERLGARVRKFLDELCVGWRVTQAKSEFAALIALKSVFSLTSGLFLVTVLEHTARKVDLTLARQAADGLLAVLAQASAFLGLKPPVMEDVRLLATGAVFGCIGIGLGLGVWFCGKSKKWSHWNGLPYVALFLLGSGIVLYAHLPAIVLVMALAVPLGFCGAVIQIPIDARLQHETTDAERGRVFALANLCTTTAFLMALVINMDGRLLRERGATQMVIDLGFGVAMAALVLAVVNRRHLRTFWQTEEPEAVPSIPG